MAEQQADEIVIDDVGFGASSAFGGPVMPA